MSRDSRVGDARATNRRGADLDNVSKATLRDLLQNEQEMNSWVRSIPGVNGVSLLQ